jgi:Fe-S cluster biogenesis protein NfuA
MGGFDDLLQRLEELLAEMERLDEPVRERFFELLDGIDTMHRFALARLAEHAGAETVRRLRGADPAVAWLLDAYGIGIDERAAAETALESIRPYIHSHGGKVEVLQVRQGVVRLKLSGACSGCSASAITLREGVEEALREHLPGFAAVEVEEDPAEPHPPPGPTLLQIGRRPDWPGPVDAAIT